MRKLNNTIREIILKMFLLAFCFTSASKIAAQDSPNLRVVFPTSPDGNTFSTIPFTGTADSVRFQQVYDFSNLTILGYTGPYLVHYIAFLEDASNENYFVSTFPNFQINVSTTARSVDGLSAVFSENVGVNDIIVTQGYLEFFPSSSTPFGVKNGAVIFFPTPFYLDPTQGNLLLDFRNFGGGYTSSGFPPYNGPAYIDAWDVAGDRVSSVSANSVDATSGTTSTLGLVTQFGLTPIPEPSTLALLALAASALALRLYRTRKG